MSSIVPSTEPVTWQTFPPRLPWAVGRVRIDLPEGGPAIAYDLTTARDTDDPLERRDGRNRLALEAFSALRLDEMGAALDAYVESVRAEGSEAEQKRMRAALGDLVAFVERFGPLGIGWDRTFSVTNPSADEAERRLEECEGRIRGDEQSSEEARSRGTTRWLVSFYYDRDRREGGVVRRAWTPLPDAQPWLDTEEPLPSDRLSRIRSEQDDLRMAIAFAEVIARNDEVAIKALVRDAPWARYISLRSYDPRGADWRRVRRGRRVFGRGLWGPFDPEEDVDWELFARLLLAKLIERQLGFVSPRVDVDRAGRFRLDDRPGTVLELIYRQLLEHLQERQGYGIGWCGYCGGAILRTRLPKSPTGNLWHAGRCANAGRGRRFREGRAQRGTSRGG